MKQGRGVGTQKWAGGGDGKEENGLKEERVGETGVDYHN